MADKSKLTFQDTLDKISKKLTDVTTKPSAGSEDMNQLEKLQETLHTSFGDLTSGAYLMHLLAVVTVIASVLTILCSAVAVYKVWMNPEVPDSSSESARSKVVTDRYVKMTFYPIASSALIIIAKEIFNNISLLTIWIGLSISWWLTPMFGILGIVQGSVLLGYVKDLYNFVLVDDWHQVRKSDP